MILNEENLIERERQLDVITEIPDLLANVSTEDMLDFEQRHLKELAEQTRRYDENEQRVVAENLDPFICFNAVGKWMNEIREQMEAAKQVFSEGEQP